MTPIQTGPIPIQSREYPPASKYMPVVLSEDDRKMLEWVRFVATKFQISQEGWVYSRDTKDLEHIRYTSDHTGYNHWTKRVARSFNPREIFGTRKSFARRLGLDRRRGLKNRALSAWAHIYVNLRKSSNHPDGWINSGVFTNWEEDGEYIAMMQPIVGVEVLDFIEADPGNPHAIRILGAMRRAQELSWPKEES